MRLLRLINQERVPIVIDTRERMPYRFDSTFVEAIHCALPAGDYSLAGHEHEVAVERKSLADFVKSVIHDRDRFEREIRRLGGYDAALVLVEADLRDVVEGRYRGHAHPNAVLGSAIALFVDHRVPFLFCSSREIAGRFAAGFLRRYHERVLGRIQEAGGQVGVDGHDQK